jgi:hypothetical protein
MLHGCVMRVHDGKHFERKIFSLKYGEIGIEMNEYREMK